MEESWLEVLRPDFESEYFAQLKAFLVEERKQYQCFPKGKDIFSAFWHTPFSNVKSAIACQHLQRDKLRPWNLYTCHLRNADRLGQTRCIPTQHHTDSTCSPCRFALWTWLGTIHRQRDKQHISTSTRYSILAMGEPCNSKKQTYRHLKASYTYSTSPIATIGIQRFFWMQTLF